MQADLTTPFKTVLHALTLAVGVVLALGVAREIALAALPDELLGKLKYLRHFSFNEEHSLPTWYSAILLYSAALLSLAVAHADRRLKGYWQGLAVLFTAMSIDESVSFHEAFITILAFLKSYSDLLYFPWVVLGIPFVLAVFVLYLPFLRRLPSPIAGRIFLAGAVYVTGALVLEIVDGVIAARHGEDSLPYITGYILEDLLEMAGMLIYLHAVFDHLRNLLRPLHAA